MYVENKHSTSTQTDYLISLKNVSKKYHSIRDSFTAVKDMNITVTKGECFALIGLNGAGKSTTFQMIVGRIKASSGNIQQSCNKIGYCPQSNSLDMKITVGNLLNVYTTMAGLNSKESQVIVDHLIKAYDLQSYHNVLCGDLSGGNKRKVCVAIANIGHPELILMDEPTSGMDPKSRRTIWARIKENIRAGRSEV